MMDMPMKICLASGERPRSATSPLDKRTAGQSVHLPRWIFNTQSVGTIVLFQYLER